MLFDTVLEAPLRTLHFDSFAPTLGIIRGGSMIENVIHSFSRGGPACIGDGDRWKRLRSCALLNVAWTRGVHISAWPAASMQQGAWWAVAQAAPSADSQPRASALAFSCSLTKAAVAFDACADRCFSCANSRAPFAAFSYLLT